MLIHYTRLPNSIPAKTANKHSATFNTIFTIAIKIYCILNRLKDSKLNAENVDKPPQNPVSNNSLKWCCNGIHCTPTPITNEARILAANVATGILPTTGTNK